MTVQKEEIERILTQRGYVAGAGTKKKRPWQRGSAHPVYANLTSGNGRSVLIVHPSLDAPTVSDKVSGAVCGPDWYHSSNMRLFPQRQHRGLNPIPYGWPMTFDSTKAVNEFLALLERGS